MAEAGFFHSPNDRDADIARCFVCFKELEGWEPEDNPMYVNHAFQVHVPWTHLQVKFLMYRTDNTNIHFFCFREEHKSHSRKCEFLLLNKKEEDWTVEDFLELETKRQINRMVRLYIITN